MSRPKFLDEFAYRSRPTGGRQDSDTYRPENAIYQCAAIGAKLNEAL
jgi:hypothetical protein